MTVVGKLHSDGRRIGGAERPAGTVGLRKVGGRGATALPARG